MFVSQRTMKPTEAYLGVFYIIHLELILCFSSNLLWLLHVPTAAASSLTNETDISALLKFKESINSDPLGLLSTWNDSIHFCNWAGITCSSRHQRVVALELQGYKLLGSISPHIGNLSFLRSINLKNNRFYGQIPEEVGHLFRLQDLVLANNTFTRSIPTSLANCSRLKIIDLGGNKITGNIPIEFGSLGKLEKLFICKNNLTGGLPPSLGNISSLKHFVANFNNLEGKIPVDIGHLKNLLSFKVGENNLFGVIPSSLYNISSLGAFSVPRNKLNGTLPDNIGLTFPNLVLLYCGENELSGSIPVTLSNISGLQQIDLYFNNFLGQVPNNLGNLQELVWLSLAENNLGKSPSKDTEFINFLTNCSKLEYIDLGGNYFGGVLPQGVGNFSIQLKQLYLGFNEISGSIPTEIGNLVNLISLALQGNYLTGIIPASIGNLQKMQAMSLSRNRLSGHIPPSIGNLTWVARLYLHHNILEGSIPSGMGNCRNLQYLDLSQNKLSGTIPLEVIGLSSLSQILNLSYNMLSGSLPREVGSLVNINTLDLSENNLSGEIPKTIGDCVILEYLYLHGNSFQGNIPTTLSSLKGVLVIDLSQNNLSGEISEDLQNLPSSVYLNLSFDNLKGEVPRGGLFSNISAMSVTGNNLLCGGVQELKLPPCPGKKKAGRNHTLKLVFIVICTTLFFILLATFFAAYWLWKSKKSSSSTFSTIDEHLLKVSYAQLHQVTGGFSPSNLIGLGSFGSVYKGVFGQEERAVAVKVLNLQKKGATKSFIAECNALKSIRHQNLVKILTCCSSTDYKEYGMGGEASKEGDMYSFGILLLEMFTAKGPTHEMFKDGLNLHNYVKTALPQNPFHIVDPILLQKGMPKDDCGNNCRDTKVHECLASVFLVGLACSVESPKERMNISAVTRQLHSTKDNLVDTQPQKQAKHTIISEALSRFGKLHVSQVNIL